MEGSVNDLLVEGRHVYILLIVLYVRMLCYLVASMYACLPPSVGSTTHNSSPNMWFSILPSRTQYIRSNTLELSLLMTVVCSLDDNTLHVSVGSTNLASVNPSVGLRA